jgi:hypothetical protein
VNPNIVHTLYAIHGLRCDQNVLTTNCAPSSLDHHLHTNVAVDTVHENIELIETPYRRAHGIPKCKQKADCREGLFSARKRFGWSSTAIGHGDVGFNVNLELLVEMIDREIPSELTLAEQICKRNTSSPGDVSLESVPTFVPNL